MALVPLTNAAFSTGFPLYVQTWDGNNADDATIIAEASLVYGWKGYKIKALGRIGPYTHAPASTVSQAAQNIDIAANVVKIDDLQKKHKQTVNQSLASALLKANQSGILLMDDVDTYIAGLPLTAEVFGDFNDTTKVLTVTNDADATSHTPTIAPSPGNVVVPSRTDVRAAGTTGTEDVDETGIRTAIDAGDTVAATHIADTVPHMSAAEKTQLHDGTAQDALIAANAAALAAEIATTDTEQTTQDGRLTALEIHEADTVIHVSAAERTAWNDKADKIDGSTWAAATGVLTIDHTDGSQTVANVGVPNVLQAVAYDAPSKSFNFTFVDATVVNVPATDLFDATAYTDVAKDDVAKTLTFTRLDSGTTVVDLSGWFTRVPTPEDDTDIDVPFLWAKEDVDQRILMNGNEIDLSSLTNQTLTNRKLHIVDNTTTLDLAAGTLGDRAWTWNTNTEQLMFYRHNGTSFIPDADDHEHEVLENIAVFVRSAGTNAGSAVQIEFFDVDGVAYPATDWTVSTAPVTGLESYTAHGPIIVSDVPYTGSFAISHNKQGFLFFKYVGDNANGLSSITYTGTNGANSNGQIIVNFVGTNYHVDFENKAAVDPTPFTKEAPAEAAAKSWVFSTDNMNAADSDKIIVQPDHNINFPGVADLESVQLAPSTGNWSDIAAGTGSFTPDAAWTFGANQNLLFGSDVLTAISNLGSTNWLLLSGGEDAPSQDARFETVALLPAPGTVNPGAVAVVYGDPVPANNKPYTARTDGVTQTVAVAWS